MSRLYAKYRFLVLRRITQIAILILYFGANYYGWKVLTGTLSASEIVGVVPLSDPFAVLQMYAAGAVLTADVVVGAIIITLFYALIGGRAFCSWVCPINMVTDLANWLRRKLYLDKVEKRFWMSRNTRYWVMGLALLISLLTGVAAFEFVSPISMLHRGIVFGMGMGTAAVLAIFLFDLFVVKNGWCGHVCPLGGFYSLIGAYAPWSVVHNQPNCTLCMKCKEVCPESQVLHMIGKKSIKVSDMECTNCGRCIEVCDDDALSFTIFGHQETKKGATS